MFLKYKYLILIVFFVSPFISHQPAIGQQWKWVINGSGSNQYSDADRDIAVNINGDQFIAGYFTKTLTLGSITLTSPDDYYSDMFLARIDSAGNVIWAKMIDLGTTYNKAMGLSLDDSSNIFLTGAYNGKIFVSKYDSSGSLKWNSDILQKSFYGYGRDIGLDQYENIFITGEQDGSAIVTKLNRDGIFQWASKVQGCSSNGAWGNDLAVDRLGNCYVAGGFSCDSVKVGNIVLRKTSWRPYTFLVKYSPEGKVLWAKMPVGSTNELSQVAITDLGFVILAGAFNSDQIVFDNRITVTPYIYGQSSFIAKYNNNGEVLWARNGTKYESSPRDIVADHEGNIYLGGIRFGNYGGTEMDFHLVKYNTNGDTIYTRDVATGGSEYLYGIDIDNAGNSYLVGHTNVKGLGVFGDAYTNPYSVFVAKFNTGSTTNRRPNKPGINSTYNVCAGQNVPLLAAAGNNVRWYKDYLTENIITSGNVYQPIITETDTFYVTQTVNNIESWPKQVIVYISSLSDFSIEYRNDSLFAPSSTNYTYQWFLDTVPVDSSKGGKLRSLKPINAGNYKVVVRDKLVCSKEASYFYSGDTVIVKSLCPGGNTILTASAYDTSYTYQWQVNTGNGYYNIYDSAFYNGTQSQTLNLGAIPSSRYGYKYRCIVSSGNVQFFTEKYVLNFSVAWTGLIDTRWENPGNWNCNLIPDGNTDVLIDNEHNVTLNSNGICRSIKINNGATLTVGESYSLTVTK